MHRHGDVVAMVDSAGEAVNTYTYDTYGNIISETEGTSNPFKYAGEHQTLPNSLIYLRNRIYMPSMNRFLQEDPIRDGTNWYVYCNNNPINYWDPLGLWAADGSDDRFKENNPIVYQAILTYLQRGVTRQI